MSAINKNRRDNMNVQENLVIEGSKSSPSVDFQTNGYLKMEGRSMPDNAAMMFDPLIKWVENLKAEKVTFDIRLDYLNTSSSLQLFTILRLLDDNNEIKEFIVNWNYEEDDEDHYETGLIFQEKLNRAKFNYFSTAEA
jgi:hypothetical protein